MKIRLGNRVVNCPAVWFDKGQIKLIDQRALPYKFRLFAIKTLADAESAIRDMVVRGAPAIGATAAYAMAQAKMHNDDLTAAAKRLKATRPTAYDLFHAVDYMTNEICSGSDALESAKNYVNGIVAECRQIGIIGEKLLGKRCRIMTHCNAGALATVDYGTALAPMRAAHEKGKKLFVYVSETRPRLQGAKLTSWELKNEGIEHAVIADGASGYFLTRGDVDIIITGADRITSSGDAANKIGTYEKAVLAKENGIPFYIAAPISTFDFSIRKGCRINIEERDQDEVLIINGKRITAPGVRAMNPAFDVTPAKYITGFITAYGIFKPFQITTKLKR